MQVLHDHCSCNSPDSFTLATSYADSIYKLFLLGHPFALLSRLGQRNRDRLLAALYFSTLSTSRRSTFEATHFALNFLARLTRIFRSALMSHGILPINVFSEHVGRAKHIMRRVGRRKIAPRRPEYTTHQLDFRFQIVNKGRRGTTKRCGDRLVLVTAPVMRSPDTIWICGGYIAECLSIVFNQSSMSWRALSLAMP
jgi:hypothetical protein